MASELQNRVTPILTSPKRPEWRSKWAPSHFAIAITPDGASVRGQPRISHRHADQPFHQKRPERRSKVKTGSYAIAIRRTRPVRDQRSVEQCHAHHPVHSSGRCGNKFGGSILAIAIAGRLRNAYVANHGSNGVTPITLSTQAAGTEIKVGSKPAAIAITPDQATAWLTSEASDDCHAHQPVHPSSELK